MKVRAEVVDFDFRGIITFFKTLSSDEIMTVNKKHKLIITLGFTSTKTLNNLNLANRLACCSRTGIVTQYLIDDALGGRHSVAWEHERAAEIQILNDGRGIVMPEKEKIRRVVREWQLCRAYNWFERGNGRTLGLVVRWTLAYQSPLTSGRHFSKRGVWRTGSCPDSYREDIEVWQIHHSQTAKLPQTSRNGAVAPVSSVSGELRRYFTSLHSTSLYSLQAYMPPQGRISGYHMQQSTPSSILLM